MTDREFLIALITAAAGIIMAVLAWRKGPSDREMAQSAATKSIAEGAKALVESLQHELDDVKKDLADALARVSKLQDELVAERTARIDERERSEEISRRLVSTEARLALAESRAATAEARAGQSEQARVETKTDLIKLGEMFAKARRDYEAQLDKFALVIGELYSNFESLGGKMTLDPGVLERIKRINRKEE